MVQTILVKFLSYCEQCTVLGTIINSRFNGLKSHNSKSLNPRNPLYYLQALEIQCEDFKLIWTDMDELFDVPGVD